jgi:hypothetical protein
MAVKIGDRVGCFLAMREGVGGIWLGWGHYLGEEIPPNEGKNSLTAYLSGRLQANPKILLESGDIVWGCECWWGSEQEMTDARSKLPNIIEADIKMARQGRLPPGCEDFLAPSQEEAAPKKDTFWS